MWKHTCAKKKHEILIIQVWIWVCICIYDLYSSTLTYFGTYGLSLYYVVSPTLFRFRITMARLAL